MDEVEGFCARELAVATAQLPERQREEASFCYRAWPPG